MHEEKIRKILALSIIGLLSLFLLYALLPYFKALFGAIIIYTLFRPVYSWFRKIGMRRKLSAILIIIISILIILIPVGLLSTLLVNEVNSLTQRTEEIEVITATLRQFTGTDFELRMFIDQGLNQFLEFLKGQIPSILSSISHITISLVILYFVLYFLMINSDKFTRSCIEYLPFNRKNSRRLISELQAVTNSTIIGMGIIALLQGALVTLGFLIFSIDGAIFWGFVAAVLSFLPIVGSPVVYVPAGIIEILLGNYIAGIGILLFGFIVVSNVDNVLRPIISRKMANLHPLITLIGVFIGIPFFGIIGLIIGPLLLSYFFLMIKMFREEYMPTIHDSKKLP